MTATIVTAFISNVNKASHRSPARYIEAGKKLLSIPVNKVVFMDVDLMDQFEDIDTTYNYFVPITKDDMYLYKYRDDATEFRNNGDPKKDTLEYMFTMCNKTEWVCEAIEMNIYNSTQYMWIDFAILDMIKPPEDFEDLVIAAVSKSYEKVRIAHIPSFIAVEDLLHTVSWYFAGSVFGGDIDAIIDFAEETKNMCLELLKKHHTLPWEINVWYMVEQKRTELFDKYSCNHNATILANY